MLAAAASAPGKKEKKSNPFGRNHERDPSSTDAKSTPAANGPNARPASFVTTPTCDGSLPTTGSRDNRYARLSEVCDEMDSVAIAGSSACQSYTAADNPHGVVIANAGNSNGGGSTIITFGGTGFGSSDVGFDRAQLNQKASHARCLHSRRPSATLSFISVAPLPPAPPPILSHRPCNARTIRSRFDARSGDVGGRSGQAWRANWNGT